MKKDAEGEKSCASLAVMASSVTSRGNIVIKLYYCCCLFVVVVVVVVVVAVAVVGVVSLMISGLWSVMNTFSFLIAMPLHHNRHLSQLFTDGKNKEKVGVTLQIGDCHNIQRYIVCCTR